VVEKFVKNENTMIIKQTFFLSQLTDHCHLDGIFIKYSLTGVHLLAKLTKNFIQEYDRLLSFTWLDLITAESRILYVI
jgi:hypothetical protein